MDDVEEAEKDIHGDNFEGVEDDNADLHVARAVEARSCLPNNGFVGVRVRWKFVWTQTSMRVLAAKKLSAGAARTKTRSMEAMLMLKRPRSAGLLITCGQ